MPALTGPPYTRRSSAFGLLKEVDPLFKVVCNLRGGLLLGDAFRLNIDQGLPESRAPDRKPDEPRNLGGGLAANARPGRAPHRVPAR